MFRFCLFLFLFSSLSAHIQVGLDLLFEEHGDLLQGKKIGLITNHTAIDKNLVFSADLFREKSNLCAIFAPEHGLFGDVYAESGVDHGKYKGIPVFSLHGKTRRPSKEMLRGLDLLVYDIQDIGTRSYTYVSTLFYCMEEAAHHQIPIVVLDRPNPLGGLLVDGPVVEEKWRSFIGYAKVPYCHGMTIGELAHFFNAEHGVGAHLTVIPMRGWKRKMTFKETEAPWVPTSPQIPESDSAFFYPATGIIGHLSICSIGVGYTLPFKIVGAPWIAAEPFAAKLNELALPGVVFRPFYFRPFFGKFKNEECQGIRLIVTDATKFRPYTTQFSILGILKAMYPFKFKEALDELAQSTSRVEMFNKLNGSEEILHILLHDQHFIWKVRGRIQKELEIFLPIRKKYLNPDYN